MNIKQLVFSAIMCLLLGLSFAAGQPERTVRNYRPLNKEKVEKYRDNPDYSYKKQSSHSVPFLEKLVHGLQRLINKIFGLTPKASTIENVFIVLAVLILVWAVIKISGADLMIMFKKSPPQPGLDYEVNEEHLDEMDFDKLINTALDQKQWRLVIRLQYLYALKKLADTGFISVRKGKTNYDYLSEIKEQNLQEPFRHLSRIFEYTWYGHFEVTQPLLAKAEKEMNNLSKKLNR